MAGALGLTAIAPAGASVRATSLCQTIKDGDVGAPAPPQGSSTTAADAKKSLKLYKKFAKSSAPKDVKQALGTIVITLKQLAGGTAPSAIWGTDVNASEYGMAADTVSDYVVDECVAGALKDLPGNVTVPKFK